MATVAFAAAAVFAGTHPPKPFASGRISGVVFDSLRMAAVGGAAVWIDGTARATVTDARGRYELDSVPVGQVVVAFSSPGTDSLGFGPFGTPAAVRDGEETKMLLATPSLRSVWKRLCGARPSLGPDSGIVWGIVQDASTNRLLHGAATHFQWYELTRENKKVGFSSLNTHVLSDSTGTYFACGMPSDVSMTVRAFGDRKASGDVSFMIGDHFVHRVDLSVSADMFDRDPGASAARGGLLRARGSATLKGVVLDDRGRAVPDALVSVSSADTAVRTARDGSFRIAGMPGGTQSVEVRSLGYAMAVRLVNLRPDETLETNFALGVANTLATYNVRAERTMRPDQAEYLERRKLGVGFARNLADEGYAYAVDALTSIPGLKLTFVNGDVSVEQYDARRSDETRCSPLVYLDGLRSDWQAIASYPVENLRAVEVFNKYMVPLRFQSPVSNGNCGVVLYWSKFRW